MDRSYGACQCGQVRFHFNGPYSDATCCHCSICRRQGGSAFAAFMEVPSQRMQLDSGAQSLVTYGITERFDRHFCGNCGVTLYTTHGAFPGFVYISLGVLDDDTNVKPSHHIFVGSKAKWYEIADGLPQFDGWGEDGPEPAASGGRA